MDSLFNKLRYTADVLASDHSTVVLASAAVGFEELSGKDLELAQLHSSEVQVRFTVRPDVGITSSGYLAFEGSTYAIDYLMDPGKAAPNMSKGEVPRGTLTEIYAHRIQDGTSTGDIPPGVLFVQQLDGSKTRIRLNPILSTNLPVTALNDEAFFLTDTGQIAVWNGTAFVIIGAAATIDWASITGKPSTFPPTLPIAESGVAGLVADLASEATSRATGDSTEATARAAADTTLQTNINTEASTRATADTTLQTNINGKQNTLGYTAEDAANKDTTTTLGASDVKYPSQKAVKTYVDSHSPVLSVAGKTGAVTLAESDVTSLVSDLAGKQASLGFTPENAANKDANSGYAGLDSGGLLKAAEFPTPTTSTFGGVKDIAAVANKVVNAITNGVAQLVQLAFSNISGLLSLTSQVSGILPGANGGLQSAPSSATGLEGFFAGTDSIWNFSRQSAAGNSFVTNNKVWVHRFTLSKPRIVGHLSICVKILLSPSTIDVGVYDSNKNLLFNLGGVSGATTGNKSVTLGAQVTLPAGDYYIAWTGTSSGTLSTLGVDGLDGSPALAVGLTTLLINVNGTRHGFAANAATAGVLPATLGALTATNTTDAYPPLMFCEP